MANRAKRRRERRKKRALQVRRTRNKKVRDAVSRLRGEHGDDDSANTFTRGMPVSIGADGKLEEAATAASAIGTAQAVARDGIVTVDLAPDLAGGGRKTVDFDTVRPQK